MADITIEERRVIERLLKEGYRNFEIANKINRSQNTLITELKRGGGRENYRHHIAHRAYLDAIKRKNKFRIFSPEEISLIHNLSKDDNKSTKEISRITGIPPTTLRNFLKRTKVCTRVKSIEGVYEKIDEMNQVLSTLKDIVLEMSRKISF